MMKKISQVLKDRREAEKKFLADGKRTIAKQNIVTLSNMSLATAILTLLSIIFGLLLMPTANKAMAINFGISEEEVAALSKFVPAKAHILLVFAAAAFCVVSMFYRFKGKASPRMVTILCVAFEVTLFGFVTAVDIFSHKETPACFMAMVIIACSSGLLFSTKMTYIINISFTAIYIICDLFYKVDFPSVWPYDVFFALVGFCISVVVGYHFRQYQISSFVTRMRYKSLSMRDPLLENIYNKRGYEDAIDNYLVANNPNVSCAFIVLDLNDFKHINDNYGHDMGDQILKCMSDTLVSLFRDTDIIGRFGGDEFIVLADGLNDEDAVEKKCRYIAELIGRRAQETGAIKVFSSLGAVICDGQSVDFDRLFEIADEAMYEAKERGRKADQFILRRYTDETEKA